MGMYIKNCNCDNCRHNNICKWVNDMKNKQKEVDKILESKKPFEPISITINCNNYEKKAERQDGFHSFRKSGFERL